MIVEPSVPELLKKAENRYELVIATARRAREIANGAKVKINTKEEKPVTIAANEIAEGAVKIEREPEKEDPNENAANDVDPTKIEE